MSELGEPTPVLLQVRDANEANVCAEVLGREVAYPSCIEGDEATSALGGLVGVMKEHGVHQGNPKGDAAKRVVFSAQYLELAS